MAKKKKAAAKKGGGAKAKAKGKAKTNPILSLGVPRFGCALVPCMRASLSFLCCSLRGSGRQAAGQAAARTAREAQLGAAGLVTAGSPRG
jgi:hypothetical protein